MSLINQMLRDLDRRRAESGVHREMVIPAAVGTAPIPTSRRRGLALSGLLLVIAAGFWLSPSSSSLIDQFMVWAEPGVVKFADPSTSEPGTEPAIAPNEPDTREPADQTPVGLSRVVSTQGEPPTGLPVQAAMPVTAGEPLVVAAEITTSDRATATPPPESDSVFRPGVQPSDSHEVTRVSPPATDTEGADRVPPVVAQNSRQVQPVAPPSKPAGVAAKQELTVTRSEPKMTRQSAQTRYESALRLLEAGSPEEAESALRHALELEQTLHDARRVLVMLLLDRGRRQEGVNLLEHGLQLAPGNVGFVMMRSRLLMQKGDLEGAQRLLERHLPASGDAPDLLAQLGSLYQQSRQFPEAVAIYRRLTEAQPDSALARAGLAISLDALGMHGEALPHYRQALALGGLPRAVSEYAGQRATALARER